MPTTVPPLVTLTPLITSVPMPFPDTILNEPDVLSDGSSLLVPSPSAASPLPADFGPLRIGRPRSSATNASLRISIVGMVSSSSIPRNSSSLSNSGKARVVGGRRAVRSKPSPMPPAASSKLPPELFGPWPSEPAEIEPSAPNATSTPLASSAASSATLGSSTSPITKVGTFAAAFVMVISVPSGCSRTRSLPATRILSTETFAGNLTTLSVSAVYSSGRVTGGPASAAASGSVPSPMSTGTGSSPAAAGTVSLGSISAWATCTWALTVSPRASVNSSAREDSTSLKS